VNVTTMRLSRSCVLFALTIPLIEAFPGNVDTTRRNLDVKDG